MVLAIDIGTTFLKVAVVDSRGNVVFRRKRRLYIISSDKSFEADPYAWESAVMDLTSQLSAELARSVIAVVISGNGPTLIPVGRSGTSLCNAILWKDQRAESCSRDIFNKLGEVIPSNFLLSKVYYIKEKEPKLYSKVKSFFSCPEYLSYLLTGESFTILPEAGFSPFYWDDEKIKLLDLHRDKFPPFKASEDVYGTYRGDLLAGVTSGIPVICGGPDFVMSLLGAGAVEKGILCDRTGTSEGLNYCSDRRADIEGLRTLPHIQNSLYTVAGLIPNSGELLIEGRYNDIVTQYKNITSLMDSSGLKIKEVRVIGGHSEIEELNLKKSKVLPVPFKVYPAGSELIGNAVFGFYVLGIYKTLKEACNNMVREVTCYNE